MTDELEQKTGKKTDADLDQSNLDHSKAIPTTLKDDFVNYEDVPRDAEYTSPIEVMQRTKKMSGEVADEAEAVDDENVKKFSMDSGLDNFLEQLSISRGQFFSFVAVFFGLIALIIVSFYFLFSVFGDSQEQVKVVELPREVVSVVEETNEPNEGVFAKLKNFILGKDETDAELVRDSKEANKAEEVEVKDEPVVTDEVGDVEKDDSALIPASEIGKTTTTVVVSSAISASNAIGYGSKSEDKLAYFLATYRKIRNIFNTDLFSYLSQVPNREVAFNTYLIQFKGANEETKLVYEELRQEIAELELRVAKLREDTEVIENKFFESLDSLNSETIASDLKAFQELSQKRDFVNSELKARQAIAERYRNALPAIETKIMAIEVNKDPFVKGVQVVDYQQVDLDLIIKQ